MVSILASGFSFMAAVRRIDYVVKERDAALKKQKEMSKYVIKLERSTLNVDNNRSASSVSSGKKANVQSDVHYKRRASPYSRLNPSTRAGGGATSMVGDVPHDSMAGAQSGASPRLSNVAAVYAAASEKSRRGCLAAKSTDEREDDDRRSREQVAVVNWRMGLAERRGTSVDEVSGASSGRSGSISPSRAFRGTREIFGEEGSGGVEKQLLGAILSEGGSSGNSSAYEEVAEKT